MNGPFFCCQIVKKIINEYKWENNTFVASYKDTSDDKHFDGNNGKSGLKRKFFQ